MIDPVCGMTIDPATAAGSYEYQGRRYYFCHPSCLDRFKADPEEFLGEKPAAVHHPAGLIYSCPMDPEVRQDHPGACPKCGMALEPDLSTLPATRVEYTCPMHPEVRQIGPGVCPKCGMALEPAEFSFESPEDASNPEYEDM